MLRHECPECHKGMGRHPDADKARRGYRYCDDCGITYSPEAQTPLKGSWADTEAKRQGVRESTDSGLTDAHIQVARTAGEEMGRRFESGDTTRVPVRDLFIAAGITPGTREWRDAEDIGSHFMHKTRDQLRHDRQLERDAQNKRDVLGSGHPDIFKIRRGDKVLEARRRGGLTDAQKEVARLVGEQISTDLYSEPPVSHTTQYYKDMFIAAGIKPDTPEWREADAIGREALHAASAKYPQSQPKQYSSLASQYAQEFQDIFKTPLRSYFSPYTGFDIIGFDKKFIRPPEGVSTKEAIIQKYGERAAELVTLLL